MGNSIHRAIACRVNLAVLALLAPLVYAFPCERMSASGDCQEVWSGLPDNEKTAVVAGLIDDQYQWNTAFAVSVPPTGTSVYTNDLVKDAWVKIMSVMPSVTEGTAVLSPGYGSVSSKSYFSPVTPSGTESGDCRTDYSLSSRSRVENYLNGVYIGTGETAHFDTPSVAMDFQTNLIIETDLWVGHYRWYRSGRRGWKCSYAGSENRRRTVTLTDSAHILRHQPAIQYSFKVQNVYYGITQIAFNASNYSWFRVQFHPDSYIEEHQVSFDPSFTLEPYYILNFHPLVNKTVSSHNVHMGDGFYQVENLSGCTITLGDYFRNYTYPCSTDYTPLNLTITTDKEVYAELELVKVFVEPQVPANVSYGNESVIALGETAFQAKKQSGLITARVDGVEAFKSIHVTEPALWNLWGFAIALIVIVCAFKSGVLSFVGVKR